MHRSYIHTYVHTCIDHNIIYLYMGLAEARPELSWSSIITMLCNNSDPRIWNVLISKWPRHESENKLEDVYDGKEYKKHLDFLSQPGNISLTLNTDGVPTSNSGNVSLWPIWLTINELPPNTRYFALFKINVSIAIYIYAPKYLLYVTTM